MTLDLFVRTVPAAPSSDDDTGTGTDDYDDYNDDDIAADAARSVSVIVEYAAADRYWVTRLRHGGASLASVLYSRAELIELSERIAAALMLEDGK